MTYGARLKDLRLSKGVSQKDVAFAIDVDVSSISYWERDIYEPKASYIVRLSRYYKVTSDFILGLENEDGTKRSFFNETIT